MILSNSIMIVIEHLYGSQKSKSTNASFLVAVLLSSKPIFLMHYYSNNFNTIDG
jgi:hypothetical protein